MNDQDTASSPAATLIGLGQPLPPLASWHTPGVRPSDPSIAALATRPRHDRPERDSIPEDAVPLRPVLPPRIWGLGVVTASVVFAALAAKGVLPLRRVPPRSAEPAAAEVQDVTTRVVGGPWALRPAAELEPEQDSFTDLPRAVSAASGETRRKHAHRHRGGNGSEPSGSASVPPPASEASGPSGSASVPPPASEASGSAPPSASEVSGSSAVPAAATAAPDDARIRSISETVHLEDEAEPPAAEDTN